VAELVDARDSKSRGSNIMSVRLRPSVPRNLILTNMNKKEKTLFSRIIDRELPAEIIAENDRVIVIKDINPQAPIHFLIIPKKEIINIPDMNDPDFEFAKDIFKMAKQLSKTIKGAREFKLLINNGYSADQRVFHLHAHFITQKKISISV
jgi:histidine triad (HIT) family protein